MLVLVLRVANFVFKMISHQNSYNPNQYCADFDQDHDIAATVYLILGNIFMHVLPIGVVLFIYRPSLEVATQQERIAIHNNSDVYKNPYSIVSTPVSSACDVEN